MIFFALIRLVCAQVGDAKVMYFYRSIFIHVLIIHMANFFISSGLYYRIK